MWCFARFGIICKILKNVKNNHGGVLILVKLQVKPATLLKVTLLHGCGVQMVPNRAAHIWS